MRGSAWYAECQRRLHILMVNRGREPREGAEISVEVEGWTHAYSSWTSESGTTITLSDGWRSVAWEGDVGDLMRALDEVEPDDVSPPQP